MAETDAFDPVIVMEMIPTPQPAQSIQKEKPMDRNPQNSQSHDALVSMMFNHYRELGYSDCKADLVGCIQPIPYMVSSQMRATAKPQNIVCVGLTGHKTGNIF